MPIPAIAPYEMPNIEHLPKNQIDWVLKPARSVLLIHDMQSYFLNAFATEEEPIVELLANIRTLKRHCTESGIPIIYTAQPGGQTHEQRGLLQDFWGSGIGNDPQQQIIDVLTPNADDTIITKWRYSAFQRTNLRETLDHFERDQLIICGIYAHIGCLMTACEAFMQDVQPFFITDAMADFSLEYHVMALTYAVQRCAWIGTTQQLLTYLPQKSTQNPPQIAEQSSSCLFDKERIRQDVAQLLQQPISAIADDDNLVDCGLDSIRLMTLVERWRGAGIELTFVDLAEQPTLTAWWNHIESQLSLSDTINVRS